MFSFPPSQKYPFSFDEDKETLLNQDSSDDKFDTEAKKSEFSYADASNESVEDTASFKTSTKNQNISEITQVSLCKIQNWRTKFIIVQ